jgi:hypothetical protein
MITPTPGPSHFPTEVVNCLPEADNSEGPSSNSPDFVSKMQMHSQDTSVARIKHEEAIIRLQPDISDGDTIVYEDEGWDSRVYVVNGGATCYKFPRSPEVLVGYGKEIMALNMIAGLDTDVRTQCFKVFDPVAGFFSYSGLVGVQLSELLPTIDASEKQRIGSKIGSFLKVLHGSELEDAPVVSVADEIEEYKAKYQLALPVLASSFSSQELARVSEFFVDHMPEQMTRLGSELRLCHGDLGSYNIIIGDDGTPGIIDFGNLGYYEQSKDFIDFGDDDVLHAVYKAYGDSPLLRAKTAVRTVALQAIDIVYYMAKKDKMGVEVTVGKLRDLLPHLPYDVEKEGA